jgi:hypothetical protein
MSNTYQFLIDLTVCRFELQAAKRGERELKKLIEYGPTSRDGMLRRADQVSAPLRFARFAMLG